MNMNTIIRTDICKYKYSTVQWRNFVQCHKLIKGTAEDKSFNSDLKAWLAWNGIKGRMEWNSYKRVIRESLL